MRWGGGWGGVCVWGGGGGLGAAGDALSVLPRFSRALLACRFPPPHRRHCLLLGMMLGTAAFPTLKQSIMSWATLPTGLFWCRSSRGRCVWSPLQLAARPRPATSGPFPPYRATPNPSRTTQSSHRNHHQNHNNLEEDRSHPWYTPETWAEVRRVLKSTSLCCARFPRVGSPDGLLFRCFPACWPPLLGVVPDQVVPPVAREPPCRLQRVPVLRGSRWLPREPL